MTGRGIKDIGWRPVWAIVLCLLLAAGLTGLLGLLASAPALAAGGDLVIEGPGLNNPGPITITQSQLRGEADLPPELQAVYGKARLEQYDEWYSVINTWPTKSWYRGRGVKLTDLLKLAGGLKPEATLLYFLASDGYMVTFTVRELVYEPRYRFPNFMSTGVAGHIPGDPSGAVRVETIIAHHSFTSQSLEEILDDSKLNPNYANHLLYGQRAVTQQTNPRFAKYVIKIEVLTDPVAKWDNPTATPPPGEVPVGTKVELHGPADDEDKVHYTLDGSDPTIESPMYNWIARRWWSSRADVLDEINRPIEITQDTTIKAFVTGPGREDSDIVTLEYTVPRVAVTGVSIAEGDEVELEAGQTKQLTAVVQPVNATNQNVTWSSSNAAVATVSETGLVTAVSPGTATITVTTQDGGHTDSITVTVVPAEPDRPRYSVEPAEDDLYTIGATPDGIKTMTVNAGASGFAYFTVGIEPLVAHDGSETVVFAHFRSGAQMGLNALRADFDGVGAGQAQAGFNVQPGDVIKVFVVDALSNAPDHNPKILQ
ncbi:MAG: Ig-like domain-containing protein [Clostridia bacterium]|nr:Ig-like domain-containing protein [Clostridia bacterium]